MLKTEPAAVATAVVEMARNGCFTDIEKVFAPPLRAAVSAETLRVDWEAQIARIGAISEVGTPISEPVKAGLVRMRVPVTCERGGLTVVMSVDEAGLLQGLRLAPALTAADASSKNVAQQLDWLLDASTRAPLPDGEIRRHLSSALLDASGGPHRFNAAVAAVGPVTLRKILTTRPDHIQAAVRGQAGDYLITVHVDAAGRVDNLSLTPDVPEPTSWTEIDTRLTALGARVSFAAAQIDPDGQCRITHGLDADTPHPIGSAFKLYVLGALAQAVTEGRVSWNEQLAIRDDWKSLPGGTLQDRPAGAALPLSEYADQMISISDNTATDHLIHRLGRDAVARQLSLFGHRQPDVNVPFLTTKAFFQLKVVSDATLAQRYLALPRPERVAAVLELERLPLPEVREVWPQPRYIDQIEWFASPADICHAYAGLLRLDQPEIHHALSLNDDGLNLDASRFPAVWYKGGNEPGVVTLHYLARTADGRTLVASLMVSDPTAAPDTMDVAAKGQSIVQGAFHLLALQR